MNSVWKYIVDNTTKCVRKVDKKKVYSKQALIFGTNSILITRAQISLLKSNNENVRIILVAQQKCIDGLKNEIDDSMHIIPVEGNYSNELVDSIKERNGSDCIDSVFFYAQQAHDLGNMNIIEIINQIVDFDLINIYSMERDLSLYQYFDFGYYFRGLKLYNEINSFIRETENMRG